MTEPSPFQPNSSPDPDEWLRQITAGEVAEARAAVSLTKPHPPALPTPRPDPIPTPTPVQPGRTIQVPAPDTKAVPSIPAWAKSRNAVVAYVAATPPTVIGVLAEASAWQYGSLAAAIGGGALAVISGGLGTTFLAKAWSAPVGYGLLALSAASVEGAVAAGGGFIPSLIAWVVGACGAGAGYLAYRSETEEDQAELRLTDAKAELETTRARTEQIKAWVAAQEAAAQQEVEQGPNLAGHTPEETALRHVVWEVHSAELDGCTVETTRTGWSAMVTLPVRLPRSKFRSDWLKIASGLGVDGSFDLEDGTQSNQVLIWFVQGDPLAADVPYTRQHAPRWDAPVHLGVDRYLNPVTIDMAYSHTLVAGSSKFGKSTLIRSIVTQLADRDDVVFVGIDMKPGAPELTPMQGVMQAVASTAGQAHALLDWLKSELAERGEILSAAGDQEWDPAKHGRPVLFVVCDELAELQRQGDDGDFKDNPASKKLESLLALMRFAGMHLIAATQQPSRKVFGGATDARGNYAIRLSTRMNDAGHYGFVFGTGGGWHLVPLDMPGKFTVSDPDHQHPAPYKGMYLSGAQFREEIARIAAKEGRAMLAYPPLLPMAGAAPGARSGGRGERVVQALTAHGSMSREALMTATGMTREQLRKAVSDLRGRAVVDGETVTLADTEGA